jgi:hypothetical protein
MLPAKRMGISSGCSVAGCSVSSSSEPLEQEESAKRRAMRSIALIGPIGLKSPIASLAPFASLLLLIILFFSFL